MGPFQAESRQPPAFTIMFLVYLSWWEYITLHSIPRIALHCIHTYIHIRALITGKQPMWADVVFLPTVDSLQVAVRHKRARAGSPSIALWL